MVRIFILDDEEAACNILRILIEKHVPVEKVVAHSTQPLEALEAIRAFRPTLLLLDIEMPHLNGFDFLNRLGAWDFDVIFTTAYDQYAIRAIRFSALDYLLKPIDIPELKSAIHRHIVRHEVREPGRHQLIRHLFDNLAQNDPARYKLALSTADGVTFSAPADIIRCEGESNYTTFHFIDRKSLLVSRTLREFEDLLAEHGFYRVHKSHLVNTRHVKFLGREGSLAMADGSQIPVSRRHRDALKKVLISDTR